MRRTVCGVLMAGLMSTPALAQEPPVSASAGVDFTSAYFFRGYLQENEGLIAQPWVDVAVAAGEAVSLNFGVWTSLHSADATGTFYEADYYAGATFALGKVSPGVLYTAYTSPDDIFSTIHELAISASFDDSESAFPLSPSVMFAFDLENPVHYWEIGAEPAIPMREDAPLSLSVPITLGMSLKDYYATTLGFFSIGLNAAIPVSEKVEVWGGLQLLALGDGPRAVNDGDRGQAIVAGGVSVGF
jgi:hypothetical protein